MTINDSDFYNWQRHADWDKKPWNSPSPNLLTLRDYLIQRWGGVSLGIHADRTIRAGSSPSSHASGAALDWRWGFHSNWPSTDFISREVLDAEVIPFLINHSLELGIQAIHDQGRIWRSDRTGTEWDARWRDYNTGYGPWLHIETTMTEWKNKTPIPDRLDGIEVPPPPPAVPGWTFDPATGDFGLWPLNPDKVRLAEYEWIIQRDPKVQSKWTDEGDAVRYFQGVIHHKAGGDIAIDGDYGPHTAKRCADLQSFFGLKVDKLVGPNTWGIIDFIQGL